MTGLLADHNYFHVLLRFHKMWPFSNAAAAVYVLDKNIFKYSFAGASIFVEKSITKIFSEEASKM